VDCRGMKSILGSKEGLSVNLRSMGRNHKLGFVILGLWALATGRWRWRSSGGQTVAGG